MYFLFCRSRNSLVSERSSPPVLRARKRRSGRFAAESADVSFGSNVSIIFKGDESLEESEAESVQRLGKLPRRALNTSVCEASELSSTHTTSTSRRQSLSRARTTGRRQSARLSKNFQVELAKHRAVMAESSAENNSNNHSNLNNHSISAQSISHSHSRKHSLQQQCLEQKQQLPQEVLEEQMPQEQWPVQLQQHAALSGHSTHMQVQYHRYAIPSLKNLYIIVL